MRLNGANILELSLSMAFALVVFATSLHLVQESTERINKGFEYQKFQQNGYITLLKLNELSDLQGNKNSINDIMNLLNKFPTTTINQRHFTYDNSNWEESEINIDITQAIISDSRFNKNLYLYKSSPKAIKSIKNGLATLKIALIKYYNNNNIYPPSHHLNFLVQTNILEKLPKNPYSNNRSINYSMKTITNWHYMNNNNTIQIYAYSHPNIKISWNY